MSTNKNTFPNDEFSSTYSKKSSSEIEAIHNSCVRLRNIYGGILGFLFICAYLLTAPYEDSANGLPTKIIIACSILALFGLIFGILFDKQRRKLQSLTNYLKFVIFKECINETRENVEFRPNVTEVEKNRLSKILPKSTTLSELEDSLSGVTRNKTKFFFCECKNEHFKGQCLEITTDKRINADVLLVAKNTKHKINKTRFGLRGKNIKIERYTIEGPDHLKNFTKNDTVKLESTEFNQRFDLYSKNQIAARKVFTHQFMRIIKKTTYGTVYAILCSGNKIVVLTKQDKDYFDWNKKELSLSEYKKTFKRDLLAILKDVDYLAKPRQ